MTLLIGYPKIDVGSIVLNCGNKISMIIMCIMKLLEANEQNKVAKMRHEYCKNEKCGQGLGGGSLCSGARWVKKP